MKFEDEEKDPEEAELAPIVDDDEVFEDDLGLADDIIGGDDLLDDDDDEVPVDLEV